MDSVGSDSSGIKFGTAVSASGPKSPIPAAAQPRHTGHFVLENGDQSRNRFVWDFVNNPKCDDDGFADARIRVRKCINQRSDCFDRVIGDPPDRLGRTAANRSFPVFQPLDEFGQGCLTVLAEQIGD